MNKTTLIILTLSGLLLTNTLAQYGRGQTNTTLPWHTDAKAAFEEAKKTGKPILAVFR